MLNWSRTRLLTTLAFAALVAMEIASWITSQAPAPCIVNPTDYIDYYSKNDECPTLHVFLIKSAASIFEALGHDWITALATAVIAAFTATIYFVNKSQLRHAHEVERAYLSGGGGHSNGVFQVCVNNFGKTPGELIRMEFGFCEADNIPPVPRYTVPRFFQDNIRPSDASRYLEGMDVPIPLGLKTPVIFGRYYYRDIFMRDDEPLHYCGFILEIRGGARTTWPIEAPRAHTAWD